MTQQLNTELGKSYWDSNGVYQKEFDEFYNKLVPLSGASLTLNGELIRSISRLFYEYCNNGNCNACEVKWGEEEYNCVSCNGSGEIHNNDEDNNEIIVDCDTCYGSGKESEEVIESISVSFMYAQFLKLIKKSIPNSENQVNIISEFIQENHYSSKDQFSDKNMGIYNSLCDLVIYYVINNEDKELPSWYNKD